MSSKEPLTKRGNEPNVAGASTASCCQPCTPRRVRAAKRVTGQHVETAKEQATAQPSDTSTGCDARCGCKGSDEQPEII